MSRETQIKFARIVQDATDRTGEEITADGLWRLYEENITP
jgi:hypothetical protein